ncbi:peptide ABC transporter substrate-binding protein [Salipiger sp. CCB-MM3]|uniref:extracellular solute-binding protein n=1 Tax=Salipiger sp. CCB-MM3 TaxID=1792508 RepID=UPI00080A99B4|nr:extracellular solute-binding protein [Salipiger sp. CCB-MM3]ANT59643.1 peptide ABC transporter substrate-binding protein [Salipiger sp. CCB-MM3]
MIRTTRPAAAATRSLDPTAFRPLLGALTALGIALAAQAGWAQEASPEKVEAAATSEASDQQIITSHGYSYFGNLDYPADFDHFDFANADAPKGGEIVLGASGTFDSMNPYSRKGRAGALTTLQYDSLIESAEDSVGQYYGLLAESLEYPEDKSWVIFHIRPEAKFWDGTPVTAEDVVYSHKLFITQGLPSYAAAVGEMVTDAEALDERTVKFTFNTELTKRSRIETVGATPVFKKAWFEEDPEKRRLDEPRMEVAVGSGPYKLDSYEVNRRIVYKLRDDYWGKDIPFNKGRHNYGTVRVEYFADQTASFEAFKAGEYTFRVESDPRLWATAYDFPRIQQGTVKKEEIADGSPPNPTGFVFNLAKPQLKDKNVREAISLAFNFEWTNESLRYGLYSPRSSFVEGTPVEAKGLPEGKELEFLQSLGDVVPEDLYTTDVWTMHESDPEDLISRRTRREATRLLQEAGWTVGEDGLARNEAGKTLDLAMIIPSNIESSVEAMHETYVQNLRAIGVNASYEKVDPSQYTLRQRERDYDMIYSSRYGAFLSTGGGLSQMYGSREAEFSLFNPAGLASPLVDAIIAASFEAGSQEETDVALMALDRALRYEFFIVPDGYIADYWVAYYDMYEHPETIPPYDLGYLSLWWVNPDKEKALKEAGVLN